MKQLVVLICCSVLLTGCTVSEGLSRPLVLGWLSPEMVVVDSSLSGSAGAALTRDGRVLRELEPGVFLDSSAQEVLTLVCGHLRKWVRPGPNLEFVEPLLNDPFQLANPNQLVASQTWFWKVRMTDEQQVRLAHSRYARSLEQDQSIRTYETWVIEELKFSSTNEYLMAANGDLLKVSQQLHPKLPRISLVSSKGFQCE